MKWVNTGQNGWDMPAAEDWIRERFGLNPGPKEVRAGAHWVDIASGDELLLIAGGGWKRSTNDEGVPRPYFLPAPGQYLLFRFFAQTPRVQPITYLLAPIGGGHFDNTANDTSQHSGSVQEKCVDYIDALFAAEPLPWSGEAASRRSLVGI